MLEPFPESAPALDLERRRAPFLWALSGFALILAWTLWAASARIPLLETSRTARLSTRTAVHVVRAPVGGRVVSLELWLGRAVKESEVLLTLDSGMEELQLAAVPMGALDTASGSDSIM